MGVGVGVGVGVGEHWCVSHFPCVTLPQQRRAGLSAIPSSLPLLPCPPTPAHHRIICSTCFIHHIVRSSTNVMQNGQLRTPRVPALCQHNQFASTVSLQLTAANTPTASTQWQHSGSTADSTAAALHKGAPVRLRGLEAVGGIMVGQSVMVRPRLYIPSSCRGGPSTCWQQRFSTCT